MVTRKKDKSTTVINVQGHKMVEKNYHDSFFKNSKNLESEFDKIEKSQCKSGNAEI